jgi:hypothetical protein
MTSYSDPIEVPLTELVRAITLSLPSGEEVEIALQKTTFANVEYRPIPKMNPLYAVISRS